MPEVTTISHLGDQGDGITNGRKGQVYVPFTLPNEVVECSSIGNRRKLEKIINPSPDRIEPICKHFGTCGGCQLQHFDHHAYLAWKSGLLTTALLNQSIDMPIDPIVVATGKRRRAVFTFKQTPSGPVLGYLERGTHDLVSIEQCPVIVPEIEYEMAAIARLLACVATGKQGVHVTVIACKNGLDIAVQSDRDYHANILRQLTNEFTKTDYCRLSINGETVCEHRTPLLKMGDVSVTPPPGGFIQAIENAEKVMSTLVTEHLQKCKSVADVFSGCGTFALRLAHNSRVLALESDERSLASLDQAWRQSVAKLKQIQTDKRDLNNRPLSMAEMKKIDGVVIDPPRAGAELQMRQIAKSKVKRVAMVSCNPITFARDLKILLDSGFSCETIVPIDQFHFTSHLETVALLDRSG